MVKSDGISKLYRIGASSYQMLYNAVLRSRRHVENARTLWALKDISFTVQRGESVGIIGKNGSGKSTLLRILARVTKPTEGQAALNGSVAALLEVISVGFHEELTGRENVYFNGAVLGMSKREIDVAFNSIVEFAEMEKFVDAPAKQYSSGMRLRLAFAIITCLPQEILLVDEVLAVGDMAFQQKCVSKMLDMIRDGRTVMFVSHDMNLIRQICSRAIWLSDGRIMRDGDVESTINEYMHSTGGR
jgi:ABC-type polysaccharide/polyol phosphate transport system ATPase subunit